MRHLIDQLIANRFIVVQVARYLLSRGLYGIEGVVFLDERDRQWDELSQDLLNYKELSKRRNLDISAQT